MYGTPDISLKFKILSSANQSRIAQIMNLNIEINQLISYVYNSIYSFTDRHRKKYSTDTSTHILKTVLFIKCYTKFTNRNLLQACHNTKVPILHCLVCHDKSDVWDLV